MRCRLRFEGDCSAGEGRPAGCGGGVSLAGAGESCGDSSELMSMAASPVATRCVAVWKARSSGCLLRAKSEADRSCARRQHGTSHAMNQ